MKGALKPNFAPRRFGKYLLLDRIGRGGMAEVFRAKTFGAAGFVKESAIKKILSSLLDDDQFVRMFIDEAKLTAYLAHPNIVQVLDLGDLDGHLFIAMEYVAGKDLLDVLARSARRGVRIPVELALHVTVEMLKGLDFAHKARDADDEPMNIVHRDVSPSNILISYDGQVKVGDFGIAKSQKQSSKTEVGTQKGKTGYMSPEQVTGGTIDRRSDLFAASVILFEMITMTRLFKEKNDLEVMLKIRDSDIDEDIVRAEKISGPLASIIRKGLSKSPDDRFQSGAEFIEALRDFIQEGKIKTNSAVLSAFIMELFTDQIAAERERRKLDPSDETGFQAVSNTTEALWTGSDSWTPAREFTEFTDIERPVAADDLFQSGDAAMVLRARHGADWEDLSLAGNSPRTRRRAAIHEDGEDSGSVSEVRPASDPATTEEVSELDSTPPGSETSLSDMSIRQTPAGRVTSVPLVGRPARGPVDLSGSYSDASASSGSSLVTREDGSDTSRRVKRTPRSGSTSADVTLVPRPESPVVQPSPTAQERTDMERTRRSTADNARVPDLYGSLQDVTVFRLIHRATVEAVNGRLRVEREGIVKDVYFDAGQPVAVDSTEPGDQLLAILEKAGQLTADECENLQERAQESGVMIEDFIVTSGALPPHTLFHFLREQLSEKLLGSLFWEDGKWAWWEEEMVEHDPFPVTLDATELLSRAVNEHAGSRYLKNFFQRRLTEPLVVLVEKNALSKTKLSPRAMRLYSNVKPGSNPDSVLRLFADRYSWSQADVFRTLYWLTERDILGFDGVDSPEFPAG